jgi:hypothetical protein
MADLPIALEGALAERLARALDVEGKIPRALEALGPVADRDVLLIDGATGLRAGQLEQLGARIAHVSTVGELAGLPDASQDVVLAWWSAFRGVEPSDLEAVDCVLRPEGRLLVVHDYGRDDVSRLRGDLPEYRSWGRRDGPFLTGGFKIRVLHCWWSFASIEEATAFLADAFGAPGSEVAAGLKRPRLSYNVAVYHRSRGDGRAA